MSTELKDTTAWNRRADRVIDALITRPRLAIRVLRRLRQYRWAGPWQPSVHNDRWHRPHIDAPAYERSDENPCEILEISTARDANVVYIYLWTIKPTTDTTLTGKCETREEAKYQADRTLRNFHKEHPNAGVRWLFLPSLPSLGVVKP